MLVRTLLAVVLLGCLVCTSSCSTIGGGWGIQAKQSTRQLDPIPEPAEEALSQADKNTAKPEQSDKSEKKGWFSGSMDSVKSIWPEPTDARKRWDEWQQKRSGESDSELPQL